MYFGDEPNQKQKEEWQDRASVLLRLVDEIAEEDLFTFLEIPEEYLDWARGYFFFYCYSVWEKGAFRITIRGGRYYYIRRK